MDIRHLNSLKSVFKQRLSPVYVTKHLFSVYQKKCRCDNYKIAQILCGANYLFWHAELKPCSHNRYQKHPNMPAVHNEIDFVLFFCP